MVHLFYYFQCFICVFNSNKNHNDDHGDDVDDDNDHNEAIA